MISQLIVAIIISVVVIICLLSFYKFLSPGRGDWAELDEEQWRRRWQQVESYLQADSPASWKMAVIEADNFLDNLLKIKGFPGKGLGDRLKFAQAKYKDLRAVWPAHLLRNKLVHEADIQLSRRQAKEAVAAFKRAAKILGYRRF